MEIFHPVKNLFANTGPRKGNPSSSTFRKIQAPLLIPAPYARKPRGGVNNRFTLKENGLFKKSLTF